MCLLRSVNLIQSCHCLILSVYWSYSLKLACCYVWWLMIGDWKYEKSNNRWSGKSQKHSFSTRWGYKVYYSIIQSCFKWFIISSQFWSISDSLVFFSCGSIPFTVDDIAKSMQPIEMIDVHPPPLLRNSSFAFLTQGSYWSERLALHMLRQ